ncbi:MAG: tetratricopeptide repeat protein [Lachnospiraceae bacterium]|nr:tetratricopeptide repeat protein [Lachnospiraceae bacterium]
MKCYNCKAELSHHDFCTNCNADVKLYKKIIMTSNFFYNQGLERAKVRDMSGAIVSLKESLKFNKNNIKARNLLGLVYFETGEVVLALSEWVISKNLKPKKNIAIEYMSILETNAAKLEGLNNTIKKYNQALSYCNSDSVDMAIIQLKKVLSQNPKFLRAHQLLALCFLATGKPQSAKRELEKCLEIDVANTTTLRYLKEAEAMIAPTETDKKKPDANDALDTVSFVRDNELIIQPKVIKERKGSTTILNILVGIALGFAVAFCLVLPARIQNAKAEAQKEIKEIGTQLDAKNIRISELESELSEMSDKAKELSDSLDAYAGTEGTLLSMENLLKAAAMYLDNPENVLDIADYITAVDEGAWNDSTSENYKALYYALKNTIGPQVSILYYADGEVAFRNKQYEDAIAYFGNGVFFDAGNSDCLYMLANSYRELEKNEDAIKYFNQVIELFPNTYYAQRSEKYIKDMTAESN